MRTIDFYGVERRIPAPANGVELPISITPDAQQQLLPIIDNVFSDGEVGREIGFRTDIDI